MKIENLKELSEKAKKVIEELTENRIASTNWEIEDDKKYFFEVESGTEKEKGTGGSTFESFKEAIQYTLEQIDEQTDKDIQECEDFINEDWYQINIYVSGFEQLIGFQRVSETEFKATEIYGFSGMSILDN